MRFQVQLKQQLIHDTTVILHEHHCLQLYAILLILYEHRRNHHEYLLISRVPMMECCEYNL